MIKLEDFMGLASTKRFQFLGLSLAGSGLGNMTLGFQRIYQGDCGKHTIL